MALEEEKLFTTKQVAQMLDCEVWQVRRIFTEGDLPEPPKFGGKRVIYKKLVPQIAKALTARGWTKG